MKDNIIKITLEDNFYPSLLKQINNPPKALYAIGNLELLSTNSIAVVGSRHCSQYGLNIAEKFAKKLAKNDITVVSGMALGIDTAAHKGASIENGKTIAVLRKWI